MDFKMAAIHSISCPFILHNIDDIYGKYDSPCNVFVVLRRVRNCLTIIIIIIIIIIMKTHCQCLIMLYWLQYNTIQYNADPLKQIGKAKIY